MNILDLNKPTVFTLKNGYGEYSVSVNHSDLDIIQMFDLVRSLLLAAGYSEQSIDGILEGIDE